MRSPLSLMDSPLRMSIAIWYAEPNFMMLVFGSMIPMVISMPSLIATPSSEYRMSIFFTMMRMRVRILSGVGSSPDMSISLRISLSALMPIIDSSEPGTP